MILYRIAERIAVGGVWLLIINAAYRLLKEV